MKDTDAVMEILIEDALRLRAELENFIQPYGIPIEVFEDAGTEGIYELHEQGISIEKSTFANKIAEQIEFMPLIAVRAICLGAGYLLAGLGTFKQGAPYAINLLMNASKEIGFVSGLAHGLIHEEDYRRARLAASGREGAKNRHKLTSELKAWAVKEATALRGSDMDIARTLVNRVPKNLADASQDPKRLIYEAIRANKVNTPR